MMRSSLRLLSKYTKNKAVNARTTSQGKKCFRNGVKLASKFRSYQTLRFHSNSTSNWFALGAAASIGGIAATYWLFKQDSSAQASELELTPEKWKKAIENLGSSFENMSDLDSILEAMERLLALGLLIPGPELLKEFDLFHKVYSRYSSFLSELGVHSSAIRIQEQFLRICERAGIPAANPDIYSNALNEVGLSYIKLNKHQMAEKYFEENIRYVENLKRNNKQTVWALLELQVSYGRLAVCTVNRFIDQQQENLRSKNKKSSERNPGSREVLDTDSVNSTVTKLLNLQAKYIDIIVKESETTSKHSIAILTYVNTLLELGHLLNEVQAAQQSADCFKRALAICEKYSYLDKVRTDQDLPTMLATKENILLSSSAFFARAGELDEAEKLARTLAQFQLERYGANSEHLIGTYNNLGSILIGKRNYTEAEKYVRSALQLVESQKGRREFREKLYPLNAMLSGILLQTGRYEQSLETFEKTLFIAHQLFGEKSEQVAEIYNAIGNLYRRHLNNLPEALESLAKAYTNASLSIPADKGSFLKIARDYSSVLADPGIGRYVEAEKVLTHLLNKQKEIFGETSYQSATCMNSLGLLYQKMGIPEKAEMWLRKSIDVYKATSLAQSSSTSVGKSNHSTKKLAPSLTIANFEYTLGDFYMNQNRPKEAKVHLDQALALFNQMGEINQSKELVEPGLAQVLASLGKLYRKHGQLKLARNALEESVEIETKYQMLDEPAVIDSQLGLSELLLEFNEPEKALNRLEALTKAVLQSRKLSSFDKSEILEKVQPLLGKAKSGVSNQN